MVHIIKLATCSLTNINVISHYKTCHHVLVFFAEVLIITIIIITCRLQVSITNTKIQFKRDKAFVLLLQDPLGSTSLSLGIKL